jgi:Protein of unknown function (DUF2934)
MKIGSVRIAIQLAKGGFVPGLRAHLKTGTTVAARRCSVTEVRAAPRRLIMADQPLSEEEQAEKHRETRLLAYAIWLDQGKLNGRDLEHWQEAELQIGREATLQKRVAKTRKTIAGDGLTEP